MNNNNNEMKSNVFSDYTNSNNNENNNVIPNNTNINQGVSQIPQTNNTQVNGTTQVNNINMATGLFWVSFFIVPTVLSLFNFGIAIS